MVTPKPKNQSITLGRPSLYRPEMDKRVYQFALLGLTDVRIAELLEVTESTLNLWKHQHVTFSESLRAGREEADAHVAVSLYRRARGYEYDDDHVTSYQGEINITKVRRHVPADVNAASLWLRNRQPKTWRDRREVEHSGELSLASMIDAIEGDIIDVTPDPDALTGAPDADSAWGGAESGDDGDDPGEDGAD